MCAAVPTGIGFDRIVERVLSRSWIIENTECTSVLRSDMSGTSTSARLTPGPADRNYTPEPLPFQGRSLCQTLDSLFVETVSTAESNQTIRRFIMYYNVTECTTTFEFSDPLTIEIAYRTNSVPTFSKRKHHRDIRCNEDAVKHDERKAFD